MPKAFSPHEKTLPLDTSEKKEKMSGDKKKVSLVMLFLDWKRRRVGAGVKRDT